MDLLNEHHFTEESRLKTFTSWPYDDDKKCNKKKMAEAGFMKTGSQDEVDLAECFLCAKQMDGWEEHDDPWQEHKSHAPYCLFAQIGKAENDMKFEELVLIMVELVKNIVKKRIENKRNILEESVKDFEYTIRTLH